jgi:2-dehydropantoate 2-reductase
MQIVIYGAGSIGCYLGGCLQATGLKVTLLGRPRLQQLIEQQGAIELSDYQGRALTWQAPDYSTDPKVLKRADLVLVTLKCLAMEDAAEQLAQYARTGIRVVCLQNGLGSDEAVRRQCPDLTVLRGIVGFNVVADGHHFHRGTEGAIHLQHDPALAQLQHAWQQQGLECHLEEDFDSVAWAKLQLNLNNVINALSDLPLKTELEQRRYRQVLALAMQELALVAQAKGIALARLTALPPAWLPKLITSPDWLFKRLAKRMLAIDPKARSSMWEDLQQGRPTEVLFLNGAVTAAGAEEGVATPVNQMLTQLMFEVERGQRQTGISAAELWQKVEALRQR